MRVVEFAPVPGTDAEDFVGLCGVIEDACYKIATALAGPDGRMLESRDAGQFERLAKAMDTLSAKSDYLRSWGTGWTRD